MFTFELPEYAGIRADVELDTTGAHVRITGDFLANCGCAIPVNLQMHVRGKSTEDPYYLGLVEDMIRGACQEMYEESSSSALLLTTHLVSSHVSTNHRCPVSKR